MITSYIFHFQQFQSSSSRHRKGVPRRRPSKESKSASRKRSNEKDASYESAPRKRSSEKSASQKQSSTKNATRKRRSSRSKSLDNSLERTQHKKANHDTSSCKGQRAKVKDSQRSQHAQLLKNQGTSQVPQVSLSENEFIDNITLEIQTVV